MLTFNDASKLLGLCNIPIDIQNKILLLFIGFGTDTSNIIKQESNLSNNKVLTFNEDSKTLWRYKVAFANHRSIFCTLFSFSNINVLYELRVAYVSNGSNELERQTAIREITEKLTSVKEKDLFNMFYGFDKYDYWYDNPYGTQSSVVIRNAIKDKIFYEFDQVVY